MLLSRTLHLLQSIALGIGNTSMNVNQREHVDSLGPVIRCIVSNCTKLPGFSTYGRCTSECFLFHGDRFLNNPCRLSVFVWSSSLKRYLWTTSPVRFRSVRTSTILFTTSSDNSFGELCGRELFVDMGWYPNTFALAPHSHTVPCGIP